MFEVFVLRPKLGIRGLRNRINKRISHGQFVSMTQFRCNVGDQIVDRDLLKLGKRCQRQLAAGRSLMKEGVSSNLIAHDSRNAEALSP